MTSHERLVIFPSRANKVLIKNRTLAANRGLSLLKRKRDALEIKLADLVAQRKANAGNCSELFREALFSFAKANFLETDFKPAPIIGSDRADAFMRMTFTKMIGLTLPNFEPMLRKPESLPLTGLSRGGKQVEYIRDKFQELLKVIVLVASLDYSIKLLREAIRTTNMRLNGLEYVIIPRLVNTTAYITNELDELEREEFYRLKRSQQKRLKKKADAAKKLLKSEKADEDEGENDDEFEDYDKKIFVDATTSMDFNNLSAIPIPIFEKKTTSHMAQTIITGHFPDSDEMISPTDSLLSGRNPVIAKRSQYKLFKPKSNIVQRTDPSSAKKDENAPASSTEEPASATSYAPTSSNSDVDTNESK